MKKDMSHSDFMRGGLSFHILTRLFRQIAIIFQVFPKTIKAKNTTYDESNDDAADATESGVTDYIREISHPQQGNG